MSAVFDPKKFLSMLPSCWSEVYEVLRIFSYTPTLVGGCVRDYLLFGVLGKDWDIELTHRTHTFNKDEWKNLGKALTQLGKVSYLPYEIIRLTLGEIEFEFSPPRKEIFQPDWQESGHSNFIAEYDFKLEFEEAIKRRDFTINAMGIRLHSSKEIEFLDPLNGIVHLRQKQLHHCGPDFKKDPVRFLRAIRFGLKFDFTFTPELEMELKTMPVQNISPAYLWSEMQKSSRPLKMLKQLSQWQQINEDLQLPINFEDLSQRWEELEVLLTDPTKHEVWIIALEWIGVSGESWQKYFSLSSQTCTRLARWSQNSKKFISIKPEMFHEEFAQAINHPEFDSLFDWFFTTKQLLQKNPSLPLIEMIEHYLPDWSHLYRFAALQDVKHIDPPLRAKYQLWNLCQRL